MDRRLARGRALRSRSVHGSSSRAITLADRFAVVGPPEHCVTRLRALADLGLDRIIVVPGSRDAEPEALAASDELFATEVPPRFRTSIPGAAARS